jgi:YD repeat-containing protein
LQHTISVTSTDSSCDPTAIEDQTGNTWTFQYNGGMNAAGKPTSITDPLNSGTTSITYDFSNGPSSITDPLSNNTKRSHDALGRLASTVDPLRNNTQFPLYSYIDDLLLQVVDANGKNTNFNYDGIDDFTGWTDAQDNSTSITYGSGTITLESGAGGSQTSMLDPVGNIISYTDKRGLTRALTYDALNRLTKIQYNSSGNSNFAQTTVNISYDGADRATTIVDSGGGSPGAPGNTQSFLYDGLDRITSWQSPEGTVSYSYDNAGNRSTMQAGTQSQVNYCYDAANRLLTMTLGNTYQCPLRTQPPA